MRGVRFAFELAVAVGVWIAAWEVLSLGALQSAFQGDESQEITNSRYFDYLFVQHDLAPFTSDDNYWLHTQPMLTRFILGGWLRSQGYGPEAMPQLYNHSRSPEANRLEGRIASDDLVGLARRPIIAITSGTVMLLYVLGRVLGGGVGGLASSA